ncbi:DUF3606 domain-containing protein [Xylophilus sp. GOD-11R]|uniref:DUF3606 domain-containing protein n=1 Tax=Xylophilus sp. GOD-11R TaxID=3089814 RepID=UPI00298C4A1E|nr:DUF3606 domain-containing protein [Xylophilus sp. GOD-11R]WPB58319.1 DUF3606 domain-containing protein [Xylophilus sp. GOD-11R]
MSDDKRMTGGQDRDRISLSEDYEVRDRSTKFGFSADERRAAARAVGNRAAAVEAHWKDQKR